MVSWLFFGGSGAIHNFCMLMYSGRWDGSCEIYVRLEIR